MAGKNGFSLISKEKFRQLYHALMESQQHEGAPRHAVAGPAGLALDLRAEDTLLLPAPDHFAHRVKAAKAASQPTHNGTGGPTLGSRLSQAIAVAVNNRVEKNHAIVLVLFELTSGTPLSTFDEVFSLAVAGKLPILFVLESHHGFTDSATFKEMHATLPYIAVDAHDVVAVYRVAQESIVRTREGAGPAVIELASYSPEDPVDKMHRYLSGKGLPADKWKDEYAPEAGMTGAR
jgi:Dehydrogenase E1 component